MSTTLRDVLTEIIRLAEFHTLDASCTEAEAVEDDDAIASNNYFIIREATAGLKILDGAL